MHQSRKEQGLERSSRRLLSPDRREAIIFSQLDEDIEAGPLNGLADGSTSRGSLVQEVNEEFKISYKESGQRKLSVLFFKSGFKHCNSHSLQSRFSALEQHLFEATTGAFIYLLISSGLQVNQAFASLRLAL